MIVSAMVRSWIDPLLVFLPVLKAGVPVMLKRWHGYWCLLAVAGLPSISAQDALVAEPQAFPGTRLLTEVLPLDEVMVAGIDRYALKAIEDASNRRREQNTVGGFDEKSGFAAAAKRRKQFSDSIGVVDNRLEADGLELVAGLDDRGIVAETEHVQVLAVRWKVLDGVDATGLLLRPVQGDVLARVVAIPDADWTPEMISGIAPSEDGKPSESEQDGNGDETGSELTGRVSRSNFSACKSHYAMEFASLGCEVLVPTLISRGTEFSRNDEIGRATNLSHREFIYRQAFEMGRHVIGYEVQKVLAAVDQFELRNKYADVPVIVAGVSEGGLLALYSAALDPRIDAAIVSGYFDQREKVWEEPIYRNVWGLLKQHGDAELAALIAPRRLLIEMAPIIPEVSGAAEARRNIAAPGLIRSPNQDSVLQEIERAREMLPVAIAEESIQVIGAEGAGNLPLQPELVRACLEEVCAVELEQAEKRGVLTDQRTTFSAEDRQQLQVTQLVQFTQRLLRKAHRVRDARFASLDRSSAKAFEDSAQEERERIHEELFGRLPTPSVDPNPRSRLVLEDEKMRGYEVVLDVYEDVIASGILLLPKDLVPGEKRPVVVCQHGLEGVPMDTISGPESRGYRAYKSFAAELCRRGFIVYSPQNPYRGGDLFRTLQRKSNVLGRSLFSYIIPQHLVTLRWLSKLDIVDPNRIGFYGLSYGGKTAVRVPPMLPKTAQEPGYCLSICSADYNDWVAKNASVDAKFSYIWTGEYEIFEWNMAHVANYAELSILMTPRPFMVERGHDDGVGVDEWVAWEFAKVRRHYNKLGLGDSTEIEFFNGPHTINGKQTYDFLHRHLKWPLNP
jgi:cephalosporin-C deacetylase-like acetyl esterase